MWRTILAAAVLVASTTGPAGSWVAPVALDPGHVLRGFERPAHRFAPGHRGVDLKADAGTPVRAIGTGTVTFAGEVAGVPTVAIDHSFMRSTYLPVASLVEVGDLVTVGQTIGTISARGRHCARDCLHLGVKRTGPMGTEDDPYVDPLAWINAIPVLKPLSARRR